MFYMKTIDPEYPPTLCLAAAAVSQHPVNHKNTVHIIIKTLQSRSIIYTYKHFSDEGEHPENQNSIKENNRKKRGQGQDHQKP